MDIRFATINDIDAVTELERQCFPPEEAAEKDSFEKRLTVFPNHFWLLEDSGKLASMINGMTTDIPILRDEMFEDATMHRDLWSGNAAGVSENGMCVETHGARDRGCQRAGTKRDRFNV